MADEHSLNSNLAEILRKAGIEAEAQVTFTDNKGKRRVVDIVCLDVKGYTIGIEAKMRLGQQSKRQQKASIRQAEEIIEKNFCDAAIGLIYPDGYKHQNHLEIGKVKVAVRTPILAGKKKTPQWKDYAVKDLAGFLTSIPSQLGKPEELAKRAENAVNEAFKKFSKEDVAYIMRSIGEAAEETNVKGLLTDLLAVVMFHTKLDEIIPKHFKKADRPPTVTQCLEGDSIARFQDAYKKWLKVDYKDILEWVKSILNSLPPKPHSNDAVQILARTAQSIQRAKGSQHHDVVGLTFCNSIETAKHDGSMYTTLPAATMLTRLLFHNAKINWKNLNQVKSLRIVDFACGSGTLLIACANYILQHEKTGEPEEVAQALLEQMLYGFDVNNRAIFQTAAGLGMISPAVAFDKTQLYSMVLGLPEGEKEGRLGSLEMLRGMDDLIYNPPVIGKKQNSKERPVECKQFHFAIMNPPFTRMAIRHKQERFKKKKKDDVDVEKKLREREQYLRQINPAMSAAGNSTAFFALVDKYIDSKTGKAGIVLPSMIPSGETSKDFRIWLPKHFHILYIIVSYDPKRIFFSGNTNIGEMLLVLERKKKSTRGTKVVKLFNNPDTEVDAVQCAKGIYRGEDLEEWGEVDEISAADMAKGDWSATQFLSKDLYRIAKDIPNHWTSSFGNQINILHRTQIIIGAQKCKNPRELHATPCLWYHDTDYCDKLEVKPDCHVKPKKANPEVLKFLHNPSRLKIAWRIRFTTIKNFACRTTVPSVSASWANVEVVNNIPDVDKETVEKAVCLILNSTPAKVGTILARTNKTISYVHLGNVKLNRIPMPLLYGMKPSVFRALAKVYDEWCKQSRERLPQAHNCPVQRAIDKAVCKHTGFDENLCIKARHLLAQEPMVTGQRYQANPEETDPKLF